MTTQHQAPRLPLLLTLLCAMPTLAFAQTTPSPATPAEAPPGEAAPAAAPPTPPADAPAPDTAPTPDMVPAPAPPTNDVVPGPSLPDVAAKVDALEESTAATKATVDSLSRIKVSGYIQGRFELHENSATGVDAAGKPTTYDRFFVRRGRLKVVYAGTNAEYLLQIDATGSGVVLKDAEASFVDTWTPFNFKLTAGQFKVPFGYEVLQSSGDREMPERSRFIRQFFPNERDRGVRVQASRDWFRFSGAVVNGNFIQDAIYADTDPNGSKDVIGRVGGDFDWLVFGLSGSYGKAMNTTLGKAASVAGMDANGDGKITGDEITLTPATPTTYVAWNRMRLGADVQSYLDVPGVGGLALKGEFAWQNDKNVDATKVADPCSDVSALGWALTGVQNVGEHLGVVVRVDQFRYNLAERAGCTASLMTTPTTAKTTTYGGGLLVYGSANIKLSAIGEKVTGVKSTTPGTFDDRITFQLQAKF